MRSFKLVTLLALTLFCAPLALAWELDPARSSLAFVSIKSKDVAEVHRLREMSGQVDENGSVEITLLLDSIDTLIPIRDERMREFLFDTANFRIATLTAQLDAEVIANMRVGDVGELVGEAQLSLHGQTQPLVVKALVARVALDTIVVASQQPLVVDASIFGLSPGIEKLREMAGLESISHAVPVTFALTFVRPEVVSPTLAQ